MHVKINVAYYNSIAIHSYYTVEWMIRPNGTLYIIFIAENHFFFSPFILVSFPFLHSSLLHLRVCFYFQFSYFVYWHGMAWHGNNNTSFHSDDISFKHNFLCIHFCCCCYIECLWYQMVNEIAGEKKKRSQKINTCNGKHDKVKLITLKWKKKNIEISWHSIRPMMPVVLCILVTIY